MFINQSGIIGQILRSGTTGITGNLTATLLLILAFLLVLCIMFSIPLEFAGVIVLPFCLTVAAYYGDFYAPLVTIIVFLASIIAKNWLFR